MHIVIKTIAILSFFVLLSSCSSLKFPGVYRVVIPQGNFIEQEMVDQLEVGMNREQVRYIMGTPMIADTFTGDRWDYYFNVKRGNKVLSNYHFKVFFKNNQLAKWEGNYRKKNQEMDSTTGKTETKLKPSSTPEKAPKEKASDEKTTS